MTEFVHLHNHTDFSLLDGAASISKYMAKAKALGMTALAMTDHGNMFGALDFYDAALAAGIKPIIGCEFYMCPDRFEKSPYYHLILLAMDDKGYHNLMELNSIAHLEGFYRRPRIDKSALEEHSEGLICLSACLAGELPQQLLSSDTSQAYETAKWYKNIFGDRYYIELQRHGLDDEDAVLPMLVQLARDLDIPTVATNDIHYIDKEDAYAHEVLLCIGTKKTMNDEDRMKFDTQEFYMKTQDEMAQLFADYPEAIENTNIIADRCNLKIDFPGPILPIVDVPPEYKDTQDYITQLSWTGLERRYPGYKDRPEQREILEKRLSYELGIILKMGFDSYFLIVRDYIYWAKTHGVPVGAGRGSGAGSLVAYCIDITNVDPIGHDLLFERFLNPERVSMPDFDIDFCFEGRQQVIDYVTEKYGRTSVGQISTFGTLKAKAVVKDVARALDIPFDESNAITKLIPDDLEIDGKKAKTLTEFIEHTPELQAVRDRGGIYETLFDVSLRLEGLSRHVSTHACGVVIGRTELKNYVPLYKDQKTGAIQTQYTMNNLERCGLVKMDFLGLKTLTLLKYAQNMIRKRIPDFDLEKIPDDDKATFDMLSRGDSMMVFQLESPGMQKYLRELEPGKFEELDAMVALYRPGPIAYIPHYINTKQGREPLVYPDPALEDLLKSTYGVIVYQEQVMKVSQIIAGFTLGQADILRKIMGKKKVKLLPEQEEKFVAGAVKLGHTEKHAHEIFDMLKPFAQYGFNKSHSVCYTVLAYRTAYLKSNFPAEFYAANLSNEIGNPDAYLKYLDYVKSNGYKIHGPSVNDSEVKFNVVDGQIIYGLAGIKGVGEATVEVILAERAKNGPYKDFMDFVNRSDQQCLNSRVMEGLIYSGAFDCLGINRKTLLLNYQDAINSAKADKDAQSFGQNLLFGMEEAGNSSFEMKMVPEFENMELLEQEKEYLGFYLSGHPLDAYRTAWEENVRLDLSKIADRVSYEAKYNIIGMVTECKSVTTQSGTRMGRLVVEDYNGRLEITVFPRQWAMYETAIQKGKIYGFHCSFKDYKGNPSCSADVIYADPGLMKPLKPRRVYVTIDRSVMDRPRIKEVRKACRKHPGTAGLEFRIYNSLTAEEDREEEGLYQGKPRCIEASPEFNVDASKELFKDLSECEGVVEIWAD